MKPRAWSVTRFESRCILPFLFFTIDMGMSNLPLHPSHEGGWTESAVRIETGIAPRAAEAFCRYLRRLFLCFIAQQVSLARRSCPERSTFRTLVRPHDRSLKCSNVAVIVQLVAALVGRTAYVFASRTQCYNVPFYLVHQAVKMNTAYWRVMPRPTVLWDIHLRLSWFRLQCF